MFTESSLRELLAYEGQGPVLSLYLDVSTMDNRVESAKITLKNLLKKTDLAADAEAIMRYVDLEWDWDGRGLAVFSSQADGFFRAWSLALPVPNAVFAADKPYVKPLADLLDNYGGYGIALVDKQGARLFYYHLGVLLEQEGMLGESVRQSRSGSDSLSAGQRGGGTGSHTAETVQRNLKEAAEFAARFFGQKQVRKVVLAGTDENVSEFRALLPKRWQSLLAGYIHVNMSAEFEDIKERVLALGAEAEARQEARLVETMQTLAAKGREGAIGLDDTLGAVREGRVKTLVVQEDYAAEARQCESCGYLTSQPLETCPFCGGAFKRIPDAVDLAIRQVLQDGGDVDIVRHVPAMRDIGIGALLRY